MRNVFMAPSMAEAAVVRNLLVGKGIYARLVNRSFGQTSASHAEVWVPRMESDRAVQLLRDVYSEPEKTDSWRCAQCEEGNPDSFRICWHCGAASL